MTNKLVSIITPVFNGERYIRECIESVKQQDYPHIEHIIVDDGSTDTTADIIREYPHVTFLQQDHHGATAARNMGLGNAKGEFVKFLDADDYLAEGCICQQVAQTLSARPDEIVYGHYTAFYENGYSEMRYRTGHKKLKNQFSQLILFNVATSCPLHRKADLELVRGFDARLKSGQEWDLHLRLAAAGFRFIYCDTLVYFYRIHSAPHRITNRKLNAPLEFQNVCLVFKTMSRISDQEVKDACASYLWTKGRKFLAANDKAGAKLFFDEARNISRTGYDRFLNKNYRILSRLLGLTLAEKTNYILKRLQKNDHKAV